MLRRLALVLSVGVALLAPRLAAAEAMIFSPPEFDPAVIQKLINDYRHSRGLGPVEINAKLAAAASAHSHDLAQRDTISHEGADGSHPWNRVERTGYPARFTAENVGVGQKSMNQVIDGWRRSPPHNANLLATNARQMGIAMVYRPGTRFKTYWTLVLGAQREPNKLYQPKKKPKPKKQVAAKAAKPAPAKPAEAAKPAGADKGATASVPKQP
jgi:hypothetical protein